MGVIESASQLEPWRSDSPPWQRRGKAWFGQVPKQFCVEVDRTTPNPSFAKEGNLTRTFNYTRGTSIA